MSTVERQGSNSRDLINPAYDKIGNTLDFIKHIGQQIALSKMFGCESVAQGEVMALECLARRMPPMSMAERYNIIFGRLSLKAEAMLADFRSEIGGEFEIVERSADRAAIRLTRKGKEFFGDFTWKQAQDEPFIYKKPKGMDEDGVAEVLINGDRTKLKLKEKYATPRSRMQMLWARVVSDSVGAFAPEIRVRGYTPEEISDFDGADHELPSDSNGNGNGNGNGVSQPTVVTSVVTESPAATSAVPTTTTPATSTPEYATAVQVSKIVDLLVQLGATHEQQQAVMAKRGVQAWRSLLFEQAADLIGKLEAQAEKSKVPATATQVVVNRSPCLQQQIDDVKNVIREIAQTGDPNIALAIQGRLSQSGLVRLSDLTISECDQLLQALRLKNIEQFFQSSLQGHLKAATGGEPKN